MEEMGGRTPATPSELAFPSSPSQRCQNLHLPVSSTPPLAFTEGEWGPILGDLGSREERPWAGV